HNLGNLLELAAKQKAAELRARQSRSGASDEFVLEYAPTDADFEKVLNESGRPPIAEIHVFSHGWSDGINLGGPLPVGPRPADETPEVKEQRWVDASDLPNIHPNVMKGARVTFYGCNIGTGDFAQQFSDEFAVSVSAATKPTHFENKKGIHQVPDVGGRLKEF